MTNVLSELEACVLGLIWNEKSCTAYRVQKQIKNSPSPHWSGSAGAIYPIFNRLEDRNLIESEAHQHGKRASRIFNITPAGRKALRSWIGPPLPVWTVDIPIDPLRTRLRFLGVLSAEKQLLLLREAKDQLDRKLLEIREDCSRLKKLGDPFPYAMARGAFHVTKARINWLSEIERSFSG